VTAIEEMSVPTRARALRITYALTVAWLVILSIALGLVVGDSGPALFGLSLCAFGVVLSALYADASGLLPRGRPLDRWERMALVWSVVGLALLCAVLVALGLASSSPLPRWCLYGAVVVSLAAAGFALRVLMKA
jgi:hypothetical protein